MFGTLIRSGHKEVDLRYNYTVDQVQLYYKYAVQDELFTIRMSAIAMAKANLLAAPVSDKKGANRAQKDFQKFLDSLNPEKIEQSRVKQNNQAKNPLASLKGFTMIAGGK